MAGSVGSAARGGTGTATGEWRTRGAVVRAPRFCKTGMFAPSDWESSGQLVCRRSASLPAASLQLYHVHGCSSNEIFRTADARLVYFVAALGVVYDPATHEQSFFDNHDDDITAFSLHSATRKEDELVATAQVLSSKGDLSAADQNQQPWIKKNQRPPAGAMRPAWQQLEIKARPVNATGKLAARKTPLSILPPTVQIWSPYTTRGPGGVWRRGNGRVPAGRSPDAPVIVELPATDQSVAAMVTML